MATFESVYHVFYSDCPKEEQIAAYAVIAPVYDDHYASAVTHGKCLSLLLPHLPPGPARLLDAGCGTGLLGPCVLACDRARDIELIGLDYSADMLAQAAVKGALDDKKAYSSLVQADFSVPFTLGEDERVVDAFIVAAVFVPRHAKLDVLKYIAQKVRPGGFGVFSVREDFFETVGREEPERYVEEAGCTLLKKEEGAYGQEGKLKGWYYIVQRNEV